MMFIISASNGTVDAVRERDLERVLCRCKGNLEIEATEVTEYSRRVCHKLTCKECGGYYLARNINKDETIIMGTNYYRNGKLFNMRICNPDGRMKKAGRYVK